MSITAYVQPKDIAAQVRANIKAARKQAERIMRQYQREVGSRCGRGSAR